MYIHEINNQYNQIKIIENLGIIIIHYNNFDLII